MSNQVFAGIVQSGDTHVVMRLYGVLVTLYEATAGDPVAIGRAATGDDGRFAFDITPTGAECVFYATARISQTQLLMAVIGPELRGDVVINELTTVAAAFSMNQFAAGDALSGSTRGLRTAAGMNHNLVDVLTGAPSPVLLAAPNADQTNALRSTRSLANLVAGCIRGGPGVEPYLFYLTAPAPGEEPGDTLQALLNIARNPAHHAGELFSLSLGVRTVYTPPLFSAPDAWTLAVKVNHTGDPGLPFGGPANVAFDRNGYAWIANNVFQGTPNSGNFVVVLRPDGRPADGRDGMPRSPVFGGGLQGPGWGVTISPKTGNVWVGNFGWGPPSELPVNGTVSEFHPDGTPRSGPDGYGGDFMQRIQAIVADADGNIWMAAYGSGNVVVYPHGDHHNPQYLPTGGAYPFGISIAPDGTAWLSNSGGLGWPKAESGSVCRYTLSGGVLTALQDQPVTVGKACKVIATDSQGNAWLASGGDSTVYQLDPAANVVGAFTGVGGIDAPWGICVDGADRVWVGNFGALALDSNFTSARLTQLAGVNDTRGLAPGTAISPPTGYTLPSAGDPVLLPNGDPLYTDGTECYTPFMRATSCQVDQAGNVWVVNNWKPRFRTDWEPNDGNPGGDGIVIFVGLAVPPKTNG